MEPPHFSHEAVNLTPLLRTVLGDPAGPLRIEAQPLRGGLDSAGVTHVTVRYDRAQLRPASRRFVVKRLRGEQVREARIYQEILAQAASGAAPSFAAIHHQDDECWLILDPLRRINNWPWRDTTMPARVLRALAQLHRTPQLQIEGREWLRQWDYEGELARRSRELIAALECLPRQPEFARLRDGVRAVRRLARGLPAWRQWLLDLPAFRRTFIHGDVHPGNVMMRKTRRGVVPVFIDWGRARVGSPLEDVSSWLQSLGFWEPSARQRHDSLLLAYLAACGLPQALGRELRDAYWLAAASNLLAGAVLYHLAVLTDPASAPSRRATALAAAADGLRVIRRADACWRLRTT